MKHTWVAVGITYVWVDEYKFWMVHGDMLTIAKRVVDTLGPVYACWCMNCSTSLWVWEERRQVFYLAHD